MELDLLVVSDIHSNMYYLDLLKRKVRKVSAVLVCGDITTYGSLVECKNILEIFSRIAPVYFVPGECDPPNITSWDEEEIYNIHFRLLKIGEYKVVGSGGAIATTSSRGFQIMESDILRSLRGVVDENTIVVSHTPPSETCSARGDMGSYSLRAIISKFKPILVTVGHVHNARCTEDVEGSKILNPGPLRRGYYSLVKLHDYKVIEVGLYRLRS